MKKVSVVKEMENSNWVDGNCMNVCNYQSTFWSKLSDLESHIAQYRKGDLMWELRKMIDEKNSDCYAIFVKSTNNSQVRSGHQILYKFQTRTEKLNEKA